VNALQNSIRHRPGNPWHRRKSLQSIYCFFPVCSEFWLPRTPLSTLQISVYIDEVCDLQDVFFSAKRRQLFVEWKKSENNSLIYPKNSHSFFYFSSSFAPSPIPWPTFPRFSRFLIHWELCTSVHISSLFPLPPLLSLCVCPHSRSSFNHALYSKPTQYTCETSEKKKPFHQKKTVTIFCIRTPSGPFYCCFWWSCQSTGCGELLLLHSSSACVRKTKRIPLMQPWRNYARRYRCWTLVKVMVISSHDLQTTRIGSQLYIQLLFFLLFFLLLLSLILLLFYCQYRRHFDAPGVSRAWCLWFFYCVYPLQPSPLVSLLVPLFVSRFHSDLNYFSHNCVPAFLWASFFGVVNQSINTITQAITISSKHSHSRGRTVGSFLSNSGKLTHVFVSFISMISSRLLSLPLSLSLSHTLSDANIWATTHSNTPDRMIDLKPSVDRSWWKRVPLLSETSSIVVVASIEWSCLETPFENHSVLFIFGLDFSTVRKAQRLAHQTPSLF